MQNNTQSREFKTLYAFFLSKSCIRHGLNESVGLGFIFVAKKKCCCCSTACFVCQKVGAIADNVQNYVACIKSYFFGFGWVLQ